MTLLGRAAFVVAVSAALLTAQDASARDGVSGCSIAETDGETGRVWRYTIDLLVPKDGNCRVYVIDDQDRKSWTYCWLKRDADNPVSATCDDALDDADFVDWKAKAVCGKQNSMAYCRQENPPIPAPR